MLRCATLCLAASLALSLAALAEDVPKPPSDEPPGPGTTAYLDFLDGFRGVKFGTEFSKFTGLTVDQDRGKYKLYTKKGEDLKLGLAQLGTIVYYFFDGKFYGVSLHATNDADSETLLAIANAGFGKGEPLDPSTTIWQGNTSWATFSKKEPTGEGTLFIGDSELAHDLNTYQEQQAVEAAAKL